MSAGPDADASGQVRASRRIVFSGLGALGVAAALAGCAGGDDDSEASPALGSGTELASTADVPVGGGIVLRDEKLVLTQPRAGEFKAFTAVCTHQQLLVTSVEEGTIKCANHGSSYDAQSGAVAGGPAPSPLAEVPIDVRDDKILTA